MIYSCKIVRNTDEKACLVMANSYAEAIKKVTDFFGETDIESFSYLKYVSENGVILVPHDEADGLFEVIENENF